jgi:hypothetical protein
MAIVSFMKAERAVPTQKNTAKPYQTFQIKGFFSFFNRSISPVPIRIPMTIEIIKEKSLTSGLGVRVVSLLSTSTVLFIFTISVVWDAVNIPNSWENRNIRQSTVVIDSLCFILGMSLGLFFKLSLPTDFQKVLKV